MGADDKGTGVPRWLRAFAGERVATPASAPRREYALVLGARLVDPETPSAMLADRLETALELLMPGTVAKLLVSGEGGAGGPDEVGPMQRYLLERGAPQASLVLDRRGSRTLASLVRARDEFGIRSLLVVTTAFHVPRVLYLANRLGLDAIAVPAPPRQPIRRGTLARNLVREVFAAARAFWEVGLRAQGTR